MVLNTVNVRTPGYAAAGAGVGEGVITGCTLSLVLRCRDRVPTRIIRNYSRRRYDNSNEYSDKNPFQSPVDIFGIYDYL